MKSVKLHANECIIVGCYMLRPFTPSVAYCFVLLRVDLQSLEPVKLLATRKRAQQLSTMLGVVASVCT